MAVKNQVKSIEFDEHDGNFIKQLAKDIGCRYSKGNELSYKLNKFDSDVNGEMGVFVWVHKQENDSLWISTRKIWVEQAKAMAGKKASGINCFPIDHQPTEDNVIFNTKDNYLKTVSVLKQVNKMR